MYNPDCNGMHLLDVYYNNDAVLARPVVLNVDPPDDMLITAPLTSAAIYETDKPYEFTIASPEDSTCADINN